MTVVFPDGTTQWPKKKNKICRVAVGGPLTVIGAGFVEGLCLAKRFRFALHIFFKNTF